MSEHIFEEVRADLAKEAERVLGGVTARFGHGRYHAGSVTENVPKESPMGVLDAIDDDAKEFLTEGIPYGKTMFVKLESIAPALIAVASAAGSQTVSAAVEALAGRVLPPDIDAWLAGFIKDAIAKFGAPAQAAPAEASGPEVSEPAA